MPALQRISKEESKMSSSRWLGILGLIGAITGILGGATDVIPIKYAAAIALVGAVITALTERLQGGASTLPRS